MNKNQIFKKFMNNPLLKEECNLADFDVENVDLYSLPSNRLLDVIRTAIIHLDSDDQTIDIAARKINQLFKK